MKRLLKPAILPFALITLGIALPVAADKEDQLDYQEARRLMENGTILPLETILKKVQGSILEVELERERGLYLYEIEVLNNNGSVTELEFDATTGALIKSKIDTPSK
ncbi:MAG TPA: peptidase [Gammaproteobacteria bacterium]|nr:peptidase [Gammaproteobacteria bacterium]